MNKCILHIDCWILRDELMEWRVSSKGTLMVKSDNMLARKVITSGKTSDF